MSRRVQGLKPWIWQRISALYLGVFLLYLIIALLQVDTLSYQSWVQWVSDPLNGSFLLIGFFMTAIHAWIGLKDVIMDYVHPLGLRILVMMLSALGLLVCLVWASRSLVMVVIK